MIKNKLRTARMEKGFSQEEIAGLLGMDQSQYSRREKGIKKISPKEWEKMAKILHKDLEEIYEEDKQITVNNENCTTAGFGFYYNNNYYVTDKESLIQLQNENAENEVLRTKIALLEERIKELEQNNL